MANGRRRQRAIRKGRFLKPGPAILRIFFAESIETIIHEALPKIIEDRGKGFWVGRVPDLLQPFSQLLLPLSRLGWSDPGLDQGPTKKLV